MNLMIKILIISYSPLNSDPRVIRQIKALSNYYRIYTAGYTPVSDNSIVNYNIYFPLEQKNNFLLIKIARRLKKYYNCYSSLLKRNFSNELSTILNINEISSQSIIDPNIIIANDWNGLYMASELKKIKNWNCKIYFDAHEYAPKELDSSLKWRLFQKRKIIWALRKCRDDISIMSTVCEGIAREYEKFFGFPHDFVKVITNASEYNTDLRPTEINNDVIRLIHHGGASKVRKLELMVKMMKHLNRSRYELTFMLVKDKPDYYDYLVRISHKYRNIKFIAPVHFENITKTLNNYDIGLFLILPEHYNYKHCLPNKLFEFIQARLAIAIGPSVEMAKIVNDYKLGVVSKNFSPKSLARRIMQLTPEKIMKYKSNSNKNARYLSAEENIIKIRSIIDELAGV